MAPLSKSGGMAAALQIVAPKLDVRTDEDDNRPRSSSWSLGVAITA